MRYHLICPSCSSDRFILLDSYKQENLHLCKDCKLVFDTRIPDKETLVNHYKQYSRKDYNSPVTITRYKELLEKFEKFRKHNRILDLGCGVGYFLEVAKENNWEVYGTEYTIEAIEICKQKGIKMIEGDFPTSASGLSEFDIVTSFEVIEHIGEPFTHIREAYKVLRKGGLFYLTTPNFNSLNSKILKNKWNVICFPEHLMYFNSSSLKRILNRNGFEVKEILTSGMSPGRLLKSKYQEKMDFTDSSETDEQLRQKIEKKAFWKSLKFLINKVLNLSKWGESLKCYAVKL